MFSFVSRHSPFRVEIQQLGHLISRAKKKGVHPDIIAKAQAVYKVEFPKSLAREKMAKLWNSEDIDSLKNMIEEGEMVGLTEHELTMIRKRKHQLEEISNLRDLFLELAEIGKNINFEDEDELPCYESLKH